MVIDQEVVSSSLQRVVYSESAKALWVQFTTGSVYRYDGVPTGLVQQLLNASSHGQFFAANVRTAFQYVLEAQGLEAILQREQATQPGRRFVLELQMPDDARPPWEWARSA